MDLVVIGIKGAFIFGKIWFRRNAILKYLGATRLRITGIQNSLINYSIRFPRGKIPREKICEKKN